MSQNPSNVTHTTRDLIKTGIPLPIVGTVSIAALGIIGILFFLSRRKKKVTLAL